LGVFSLSRNSDKLAGTFGWSEDPSQNGKLGSSSCSNRELKKWAGLESPDFHVKNNAPKLPDFEIFLKLPYLDNRFQQVIKT